MDCLVTIFVGEIPCDPRVFGAIALLDGVRTHVDTIIRCIIRPRSVVIHGQTCLKSLYIEDGKTSGFPSQRNGENIVF